MQEKKGFFCFFLCRFLVQLNLQKKTTLPVFSKDFSLYELIWSNERHSRKIKHCFIRMLEHHWGTPMYQKSSLNLLISFFFFLTWLIDYLESALFLD